VVKNRGLVFLGGSKKKRKIKKGGEKSHFLLFSSSLPAPTYFFFSFTISLFYAYLFLFSYLIINFKGRRKLQVPTVC